ncbi:MAG: hypothetical protein IJ080_07900 [Oscillospiraceae bacterium]|nr:hypothetical protein [Oscillospiraceae bacterium]MBQ8979659.1 hypothetical protein [Oscillospiraceae bacterium]
MIDVTREQLERLYKTQQTVIKAAVGFDVCSVIVYIILMLLDKTNLILFLLLIVLPLIVTAAAKKKLIPVGFSSPLVSDATNAISRDFTSDRALNIIRSKLAQAGKYPEKTLLTLYLAEVHMFRGEIDQAIAALNTVDRSGFAAYPTIGLSFYGDILGLYKSIGDFDSVMLAYRDAEPFLRDCSQRNYILCQTTVDSLICVYAAAGDHRHALDLRLMMNDFKNRSAKDIPQGQTPLQIFLRGMTFLDTAEAFYECGDYGAAAQAVDQAGPMVTPSPFFLDKANRLSAAIREKQGKQNVQ